MCPTKLLAIILLIAGLGYLLVVLNSGHPSKNSYEPYETRESYGGRQSECEAQCFSSSYYDACMNVCMEGSSAGWTGRQEEYDLPAIEAPVPLEDDSGQAYISTKAGPYRYDYPGH